VNGEAPSPPLTPARAGDLPALMVLENACFDDPWTESAVAVELRNPAAVTLVLRRDRGRIAAWACFRVVADEAELFRLAVDPRDRRRGLGRQALEQGLAEVRRRGAVHCLLEVREDNAAALALYEKVGFQAVGRRPYYYRDGCAAALLALDL
jgi:[ribosomal protein S18]-alanine N-acetyltransferase